MAKLTGPLLSLGAQGQIGKSLVTASWRGVAYARQYVVPANPKTVGQQLTRNVFRYLDDQYKRMLTLAQSPWEASAKGKPFTARNSFLSKNVAALRPSPDMSLYVASPGVYGGLPGVANLYVGGAGAGEIDMDLDIGQNPVDWSCDFVYFTVFPDRDPAVQMVGFVTEASEAGPGDVYVPPITVSHSFSGLTAGGDYVCSAWPVWTRADGIIAYGPATTEIVTATP